MKILFFAGIRELTGVSEMELPFSENQTLEQVWDQLLTEYPQLKPFRSSSRLAQNGTYADANSEFKNDDEVAVIPPVSGG